MLERRREALDISTTIKSELANVINVEMEDANDDTRGFV